MKLNTVKTHTIHLSHDELLLLNRCFMLTSDLKLHIKEMSNFSKEMLDLLNNIQSKDDVLDGNES